MTSNINPNYPVFGNPTTQSVRDNFLAAYNEITALQQFDTTLGSGPFLQLAGGEVTGNLTVDGTSLHNGPANFVTNVTIQRTPAIATDAVNKTYVDTNFAPINSPQFTGDARANTPSAGDNDTSVATTAFVRTAISQYAVTTWNTRTGAVTMTNSDVNTALGFTPYDSANPSGFQTASGVNSLINTALASPVAIGSTTPNLGTFTTLAATTGVFKAGAAGVGLSFQAFNNTVLFTISTSGNVALTGGDLTLFRDPSANLHAATKQYVDNKVGNNTASIIVSDTAPASPVSNTLWFDSIGLQTYLWYNDGNSNQWTPVINQGTDSVLEAPLDGTSYLRNGGSWLSGGNISGSLAVGSNRIPTTTPPSISALFATSIGVSTDIGINCYQVSGGRMRFNATNIAMVWTYSATILALNIVPPGALNTLITGWVGHNFDALGNVWFASGYAVPNDAATNHISASATISQNYILSAYYATGPNWKYLVTAGAALISQNAGTMTFFTAPSGTVGGVISWTNSFQVSPTAVNSSVAFTTSAAATIGTTLRVNGASTLVGAVTCSGGIVTGGNATVQGGILYLGTSGAFYLYDRTPNNDRLFQWYGNYYWQFTIGTGVLSYIANGAVVHQITSGGGHSVVNIAPFNTNAQWCGTPTLAWYGVGAYQFNNPSDPRLKKNMVDAEPGALDKVLATKVKRFHWNEDDDDALLHTGWDASEMLEKLPSAVTYHDEDDNKTLSINIVETIAVLWQAVQELAARR